MEPLIVALLQVAAADPVGDLSLNYGGNAAARSSNGSIPKAATPSHPWRPRPWICCDKLVRALCVAVDTGDLSPGTVRNIPPSGSYRGWCCTVAPDAA